MAAAGCLPYFINSVSHAIQYRYLGSFGWEPEKKQE
jgi:hypothetical protein